MRLLAAQGKTEGGGFFWRGTLFSQVRGGDEWILTGALVALVSHDVFTLYILGREARTSKLPMVPIIVCHNANSCAFCQVDECQLGIEIPWGQAQEVKQPDGIGTGWIRFSPHVTSSTYPVNSVSEQPHLGEGRHLDAGGQRPEHGPQLKAEPDSMVHKSHPPLATKLSTDLTHTPSLDPSLLPLHITTAKQSNSSCTARIAATVGSATPVLGLCEAGLRCQAACVGQAKHKRSPSSWCPTVKREPNRHSKHSITALSPLQLQAATY